MLYRNDEQYRLAAKDIEGIENYFHNKFPVRVIYPPNRIVPSKLKHNRLPDKPTSISFNLRATVKENDGAYLWRYAENVVIGEGGKKIYSPTKFIYQGAKLLDRKDIELIFFLLRKSEYRFIPEEEIAEAKRNKKVLNQSNSPKFMFEDLITDADRKVAKKRIQTKIDMLLYNEDMGLPEEKLRAVAKAYFIKGVDGLTSAQVKMRVEAKIKETKDGPEKFFEMVNADEEIKTRKSLTDAMDMGILEPDLSGKKRVWQWKTKEGKQTICIIPPDKSPNEALYEHYLGNHGFRDDLQAVLITKNPNAGKKKKGTEDDENTDEAKE